MKRRKILIIGPIGDKGGREIEAGFIANVLSQNGHLVNIFSTTYITSNSQVVSYFPWEKIQSVNGVLFRTNLLYRLLAYSAWIKNFTKKEPSFFLANNLIKKYFNYYENVSTLLDEQISQNDLLIFLGQLSSNYVKEIISKAVKYNKYIFFRTTGKIEDNSVIITQFDYIDLFIHHSQQNLVFDLLQLNSRHIILDQTASNEAALMQVSILNRKVHRFIMVGDVSRHKGVDIVLEFFSNVSNKEDEITIIGEGALKAELIWKYRFQKNIKFFGFVEHTKLSFFFEQVDCLIIASVSETGPYVGLEAMAAGRLILSTRVGAMENRLIGTGNNFWFSRSDSASFKSQFLKIKTLDVDQVQRIATKNRKQYLKQFSNSIIAEKYNNLIHKYTSCGKE